MHSIKRNYNGIPITFELDLKDSKALRFLTNSIDILYGNILQSEFVTSFPSIKVAIVESELDSLGWVEEKDIDNNITRVYLNYTRSNFLVNHEMLEKWGEHFIWAPVHTKYFINAILLRLSKTLTHELAHLHHAQFQNITKFKTGFGARIFDILRKETNKYDSKGDYKEGDFLALYKKSRLILVYFFGWVHAEGYAMLCEKSMANEIQFTTNGFNKTYDPALEKVLILRKSFDDRRNMIAIALTKELTSAQSSSEELAGDALLEKVKYDSYVIGLHIYQVLYAAYPLSRILTWNAAKVLRKYVKASKKRNLPPLFSYDSGDGVMSYKGMVRELNKLRILQKPKKDET